MAKTVLPKPEDQLLTLEDVVLRLKSSRSTVLRLIQRGRLRYCRLGQQYRFKQEWITAFIEGRR